MAAYWIALGDTLPTLNATLLAGGEAYDLTGCTVQLRYRKRGSTTTLTKSATVVDATAGTVQYAWQSGDLTEAGTYEVQWRVTDGSDTYTFPNGDPASFEVRAAL